jgi:TP901 family phage tail tape measure protein
MNAMLNIVVRVDTTQANAAWKSQRAQLNGLQRAGAGLSRALNPDRLISWGKNLQWTGRQLEFAFTLPLVLAGAAATKWQLENEKAMTEVKKVYGDLSTPAKVVREETDALAKSFELLSSRFGENQKEVIEIGAAWAQAGASGVALADNTRTTLETMILSGMDATESTEALVSIMSVWNLSNKQNADGTSELTRQLAVLNAIENETSASYSDLITVLEKAGGVARIAGVDIQHLAAFTAALVPAGGSAAQAGNGLKTVISRLQAPTRDTVDLLEKLGFNVASPEWLGKSATDKILALAEQFKGLSRAQQTQLSSVIASRWQVNKFAVLLEDINDPLGNYQKALDASSSATGNQTLYLRELTRVLESNPRKWDILVQSLKNALTTAIIPLIPAIFGVVSMFVQWAQAFSRLEPERQKFWLGMLVILAALGPVMRYLGTTAQLLGEVAKFSRFLGRTFIATAGLIIKAANLIVVKGIFPIIKSMASWVAAQVMAMAGMVSTWIAGFGAQATASTTAAGISATAQAAAAGATADAWAASMSTVSGMFVTTGAVINTTAVETMWLTATTATAASGTAGAASTGMLATVTGALGAAATAIAGFFTTTVAIVGLPLWAVVAIVAAVIAAVIVLWRVGFYEKMIQIWKNIIEGIWALPQAFMDAMKATIRIVNRAVEIVHEALSYLNPFARHSPSLVDNVKAGISTILSEYSRLRGIPQIIAGAAAAHDRFMQATRGGRGALEEAERLEQREQITNYSPEAGPAVDNMQASIAALKNSLQPLTIEINRQEAVVARWQAAYDRADAKVKQVQDTIDVLQYRFDVLDDVMSKAQATLNDLGSTDLPGMRAAEDQIFANEMAQKALRLEIMRLEEAGVSVEDLRSRMSKLQGEIEMVQGTQNELRLAGAGSEILGFYDAQIDALRDQQDALTEQGEQIDDLTSQLEKLQQVGERLDLEHSINFDPQLRQIDQMIDGLNEMPFDEIIRQVTEQRRIIDATQPAYDAAKKALEDQQVILRDMTYQRDQIGNKLDIEKNKAELLNQAYNDIESQINEMESALSGFASMAQSALDKVKDIGQSLNEELFDAGAGANFPVQGGTGGIESYGDLEDIEAWNDEMQAELDRVLEGIGGFDMFKGFKDKWNAGWKWVKEQSHKIWDPIQRNFKAWVAEPIAAAGGWIGRNFSLEGLKNVFSTAFGAIKGVWNGFTGAIKSGYDTYIKPTFDTIKNSISNVLTPVFNTMSSVWSTVWDAITGALDAAWGVISPIFEAIGGFIGNFLIPIFQAYMAVVEIVWTVIGRVISAVWEKVIKVVFSAITNWFDIMKGGWMILGGIVGLVWSLISRQISMAWGIIQLVFKAIQWWIGNVVIPAFRLVQAVAGPVFRVIGDLISKWWNGIVLPVFNALKWAIENVVAPAFRWVRDKVVKPIMTVLGDIVKEQWNRIAGILEGGINLFAKAFNFIAKGIRAVAGVLKIDIKVNDIEEVKIKRFAMGGALPSMEVGAGFVTNGARAIVGEGSRIHPEYVIPTDPRYRNRASQLLADAASTILGGGRDSAIPRGGKNPAYLAWGGIIPTPGDVMDGIKNVVGELKKGALKLAFAGPSKLADEVIKKIPIDPVKRGAKSIKDQVYNWVTQADKDADKAIAEAMSVSGQYANHPARGKVMNWITSAINNLGGAAGGYPHNTWAPGDFTIAMRESGGNPLAMNLWDSNAAKGTPSMGLMQTIRPTFDAYKVPGFNDIWNPVHNVMAANRYIKARYGDIRNVQQAQSNMPPKGYAFGGTIDAALARGGAILNRKAGGMLLHVGEGNNDEEVQVRPLNRRDDDGKTINFYGDLVFPNVENASDAEDFIRSIESLGS